MYTSTSKLKLLRKRYISKDTQTALQISKYAAKPPNPVSLKDLIDFGMNPTPSTLKRSINYLCDELPIQMAQQINEMDRFPYGLCLMPCIKQVRSWYVESFKQLLLFDDLKDPQNEDFVKLVNTILERHKDTFLWIGKGVYQLKKELSQTVFAGVEDLAGFVDLHQALDSFYTRRIGLRILLEQHIALAAQMIQKNEKYVGIIRKDCSPSIVIHEAIENASFLVARFHGTVPTVKILGNENLRFPFVTHHLYYILFELLKNSMRATVEKHQDSVHTPDIKIIIGDGEEDITIKLSDEGGGIKRNDIKKIWSYMYSSAEFDYEALENLHGEQLLAGMGYGLPVSKCYAKYFGGDLDILSVEGYGTDAYLYLNKLGE